MTKDLNKDIISFFPSYCYDNDNLLDFLNKTSNIICNWFSETGELSPIPIKVDTVKGIPNDFGCNSEELLSEIQKLIYSSYNPSHPGSLAHLDPPPLTFSIIGDLIASSLNNNLLADELSPSISLLENEICKWLADQLNLGNKSGGIAASGGTLNNLNALVTARFYAGLQHDPEASFIVSKDAHVSFNKCARILGLKSDNLIFVDTDSNGGMSIQSLVSSLERAKSQNKKIFAVVATLGTTIKGAIDPIKEISRISMNEKIWLHIDGSIGGIYTFLKEDLVDRSSVKYANSITINPQKILGITKTSSILLVSDISSLKNTFQTGLPYIDSSDEIVNRGELGVQGSRPAEIIKLWLGLRFLGLNGISKILRASLQKRELLQSLLDKNKFDIYGGPLHIICFHPKAMNIEDSDEWTLNTKKFLMKKNYMVSRPFYNDRFLLRIVLGNYNTNDSHLRDLAKLINSQ